MFLLGWYADSKTYVELQLKKSKDKVTLKQKFNGTTVTKNSVTQQMDTGTPYHIKITFNGTAFQLYWGSTLILTQATGTPSTGNVGFRVKGSPSTGLLLQIKVQ